MSAAVARTSAALAVPVCSDALEVGRSLVAAPAGAAPMCGPIACYEFVAPSYMRPTVSLSGRAFAEFGGAAAPCVFNSQIL